MVDPVCPMVQQGIHESKEVRKYNFIMMMGYFLQVSEHSTSAHNRNIFQMVVNFFRFDNSYSAFQTKPTHLIYPIKG